MESPLERVYLQSRGSPSGAVKNRAARCKVRCRGRGLAAGLFRLSSRSATMVETSMMYLQRPLPRSTGVSTNRRIESSSIDVVESQLTCLRYAVHAATPAEPAAATVRLHLHFRLESLIQSLWTSTAAVPPACAAAYARQVPTTSPPWDHRTRSVGRAIATRKAVIGQIDPRSFHARLRLLTKKKTSLSASSEYEPHPGAESPRLPGYATRHNARRGHGGFQSAWSKDRSWPAIHFAI